MRNETHIMQPAVSPLMQPAAYPSAPYGTRGASDRPMHGQERSYGIVLLLYVVTLGIYGLYWHYKTHDELCQQLGRENKDKGLWIGYIVLQVVVVFFALMLFLSVGGAIIEAAQEDRDLTEEEILGIVTGGLGFILLVLVAGLVGLVLFIMYTLRQLNTLQDAHARWRETPRLSGGAFMGFYFGALAAEILLSAIGVGILVAWGLRIAAYFMFQDSYNHLWRQIEAGRPLPTDAEWQGSYGAQGGAPYSGSGQQRTAWDAPGQTFGQPVSYGAQSSSQAGAWDAPDNRGSSYGAPAPVQRPSGGGPRQWDGGASGGQGSPSGPTRGASSFSVGQRGPSSSGAGGPTPGATGPSGPIVRQSFVCPRCHAQMPAAGPPGASVDIHCTSCGESGRVTLPR